MSRNTLSARTELIAKATVYSEGYGDISVLANGLLAEIRSARRKLAKETKRANAAEAVLAEIIELTDFGVTTPYGLCIDEADLDAIFERYRNR